MGSRPATRSGQPRGRSSHTRVDLGVVRGNQAAAPALDRTIHQPLRLSILSMLAVNEHLSFTELRGMLAATDGNLSVHARKLEDAGYLECSKSFAGRTPRTEYRITPSGRGALERYLGQMEAIIASVRGTEVT